MITVKKSSAIALFAALTFSGCIASTPSFATDAEPILVKDINVATASSEFGATDTAFAQLGNEIFFSVETPNEEYQFWKSDGTAAGTSLIKTFDTLRNLVTYNGKIYFAANDGLGLGTELWASDGSTAGTALLKDLYLGPNSSSPGEFEVVGNTLFFAASNEDGTELWKTDGTSDGTSQVKDIRLGSSSSGPDRLRSADLGLGPVLFFVANEGSGSELFISDGTADGTQMVLDIGPNSGFQSREIIPIGSFVYFSATDSAQYGTELWRSDGTPEGTRRVTNLFNGPNDLVAIGTKIYFHSRLVNGRTAVWVYDTTRPIENETIIVSSGDNPDDLIAAGTRLFFEYETVNEGVELWSYDGTVAALVRDIRPGEESGWLGDAVAIGNLLYFESDGPEGEELWRSDGTLAGTYLVKDIRPGSRDSEPQDLINFGGNLFFTAFTPEVGREIYISDGTEQGTGLIKDLTTDSLSALYEYFEAESLADTLFFVAYDPTNGAEIWKSDGSAAGTMLVKDIWSGPSPSQFDSDIPKWLTPVGQTLFFSAYNPLLGNELWKTDGTEAGTVIVKDLFPGEYESSSPTELVAVGNRLFFEANSGDGSGRELYVSDGTSAGTTLVTDIYPGPAGAGIVNPVAFGNKLIFQANDGSSGAELWVSDGTSNGTTLIDLVAGGNSSNPDEFTQVGNTILFAADSAGNSSDRELWRTDGTISGTSKLKDINPGVGGSYPQRLTPVGNNVFFTADDGSGESLWISDGTAEGTRKVQDTPNLTAFGSTNYPPTFAAVGDNLVFVAAGPVGGMELWVSDGTSSGTRLLKDINTSGDSSPTRLTSREGKVLFFAENASNGIEPWITDGTAAGTRLLKDIQAGSATSIDRFNNFLIGSSSSSFFFAANDGFSGFELWRYQFAQPQSQSATPNAPVVTYEGPIVESITQRIDALGTVRVSGLRLDTVSVILVNGNSVSIIQQTPSLLTFTMPNLSPGRYLVTLVVPISGLNLTTDLEVIGSIKSSSKPNGGKVNVGSFNGKLVVYAAGLEGKRISWKVGGRWGRAVANSSFARFDRPTPRRGVEVNVEIFVDGVSQLTKRVVTR